MNKKIAALIYDAIKTASPDISITAEEIESFLEVPPQKDMGDLAFPCFRLAKAFRTAPPKIAQLLSDAIEKPDFLSRIESAGGYLNFYIDRASLAGDLLKKLESGKDPGSSDIGKGKTICIDYSSPNVAKNFHVGHLRTTIIGNSLYHIFEKQGYNVERINYLGDWGTQFGKLIVAYKKWGNKELVQEKGIEELMELYVRFHSEAETDPSLEDEARAWFLKMEQGDPEAISIWQWFREISVAEFMRVYDILGVSFDSFNGEAFYNDKMGPAIEELKEKGLLIEDDGAMIVDLSEYDMPPCLVLKKDGSTLYATRDIAAAIYRKKQYDFEKCVYVTGLEQKLHFAQWFKVIELMGYDWYKGLVHVPYGLVSLPGGKMSSRKGNVIFVEDILKEAISKTTEIIEEKNPDLPDKAEVARQVGVGAVIFSTLYNQRIKDVVFVWDKILSFDGETGPYVQYTHARCCSLLNKVSADTVSADPALLSDEPALDLLRELTRYDDVIAEASEKYEPSIVARYSMAVAQAFNRFYHEDQINTEDAALRSSRLFLVDMAEKVLRDSLTVLGMEAPNQM